MSDTQSQVLSLIVNLMKTGNTHYIKPAPDTMIDLLWKIHKKKIGRRQYFKIVKQLIDEEYICRQRRFSKRHAPDVHQLPSIISFTMKGVKHLIKFGVTYAYKLYKQIVEFLKRGTQQFPAPLLQSQATEESYLDIEENLRRLRELMRSIGITKREAMACR